jgi:hypothetical protein
VDLIDTYNEDRQEEARKRVSKMKQIKEKIGQDAVPMLYDLMIKCLKRTVHTINHVVAEEREYDQLKLNLEAKHKSESGDPVTFDLNTIKWHQLTMEELKPAAGHQNKDAKYFKLFPSWYIEKMKQPNLKSVVECNFNFYCNEGVYESMACGIIFYEILRCFQLNNHLIKSSGRKYASSLDLFLENSGFGIGKRIWNAKREKYTQELEEKKRQIQQEATQSVDGTTAIANESLIMEMDVELEMQTNMEVETVNI